MHPSRFRDRIMAEHARTFHFAACLFPDEIRHEVTGLYAFFRVLDDRVDEHARSMANIPLIRAELDGWSAWFSSANTTPPPRLELGAALSDIVSRREIPYELFLEFLDGMCADLGHRLPDTNADLEAYSHQVASTVGLAMS